MPDGSTAPGAPRSGGFVAVVGPSGAGKDTVIAEARARLRAEGTIRFARRVVTRPVQVEAEDHDTLDDAGFAAAEAAGGFCLAWRAHGLSYGIPARHLDEARNGVLVVANVSRRALAAAAAVFGPIEVVEITAAPELLAERIAARGREAAAAAADRLRRQVPLVLPDPGCHLTRIDNSGAVDTAVDAFTARLRALAGSGNA